MSRIGKIPVLIPAKVKVEIKGRKVFVEGPKGKLDFEVPRRATAKSRRRNELRARFRLVLARRRRIFNPASTRYPVVRCRTRVCGRNGRLCPAFR